MVKNKSELKELLLQKIALAEKTLKTPDLTEYSRGKSEALIEFCGNILKSPLLKGTKEQKVETDAIFKNCIRMYDGFFQTNFDLPPQILSIDFIAMRKIIEYIEKILKQKETVAKKYNPQEIIDTWEIVLSKWKTYPPRIRDYVKISHIQRNLADILIIIKNNRKKDIGGRTAEFTSVVKGFEPGFNPSGVL